MQELHIILLNGTGHTYIVQDRASFTSPWSTWFQCFLTLFSRGFFIISFGFQGFALCDEWSLPH